MKRTTVLAYGATLGLLSLITAGVLIGGCKSDDDDNNGAAPARLSQKNEACQSSNDCADGLACRPYGSGSSAGVCVISVFKIAPEAKSCVDTQCSQPVDCCEPLPSGLPACPDLLTFCGDSGPTNTYCQYYKRYCNCDGSNWRCTSDKCALKCAVDDDCLSSSTGHHCSAGQCVACADNSHCASGETCNNGVCQGPCTLDSDCPNFDRCQAGKCVNSGCQSDRECVAATKNVEATCMPDGTCSLPCVTDLDCGSSPTSYAFVSCVDHKCIDTGCANDKECSLKVGHTPTDPRTKYVCRDRPAAQ